MTQLRKVESAVSRLFLLGAFVLVALAVAERVANELGYTILRVVKPATVLGAAVVVLVFVLAMEVRAIRESLERRP